MIVFPTCLKDPCVDKVMIFLIILSIVYLEGVGWGYGMWYPSPILEGGGGGAVNIHISGLLQKRHPFPKPFLQSPPVFREVCREVYLLLLLIDLLFYKTLCSIAFLEYISFVFSYSKHVNMGVPTGAYFMYQSTNWISFPETSIFCFGEFKNSLINCFNLYAPSID